MPYKEHFFPSGFPEDELLPNSVPSCSLEDSFDKETWSAKWAGTAQTRGRELKDTFHPRYWRMTITTEELFKTQATYCSQTEGWFRKK